jgi:hypothetical protein
MTTTIGRPETRQDELAAPGSEGAGAHAGGPLQAFSHLALIEAAGRIILAERLEEL